VTLELHQAALVRACQEPIVQPLVAKEEVSKQQFDLVVATANPNVDFMAAQYPGNELWAAGFSFGAYVALTAGATDDRICALIGIAPPVNRYDFEAVKTSPKPKFIIHGEADELIPMKQVREFYAQLADPKELVEIDRANHLFDGQVSEVADAIEDLLADFSCRTQ